MAGIERERNDSPDEVSVNRKRAALAVAPFLALGLADIVLLLFWGLDPLWGFVILPPILFISVLAWIGFRSGFIGDRAEDAGPEIETDSSADVRTGTEAGAGTGTDREPGRDGDAEDAA